MKITKTQLKQIIKEELEAVLDERFQAPGDSKSAPAEPGSHWDTQRRAAAKKKKDDEEAERKAMRKHCEEQCRDARDYQKCMGNC